MTLLLGCIADDFTGGTDLAGMLVKNGLRTVLMVGVPETPVPADIDAVVIALKSRTTPAADAIAQSLAALHSLQAQGCRQIYFKYCSTFDSTPASNIGPVAEALMDAPQAGSRASSRNWSPPARRGTAFRSSRRHTSSTPVRQR